MNMKNPDLNKYKNEYDEQTLMSKISRFAKKAGLNTIYYVLLLYNLLLSDMSSIADKAVIIGALGYFICPLDIVPDLMIGTGFLDDAAVLTLALSKLVTSITPAIKAAAKAQLHEWFDFEASELDSKYR